MPAFIIDSNSEKSSCNGSEKSSEKVNLVENGIVFTSNSTQTEELVDDLNKPKLNIFDNPYSIVQTELATEDSVVGNQKLDSSNLEASDNKTLFNLSDTVQKNLNNNIIKLHRNIFKISESNSSSSPKNSQPTSFKTFKKRSIIGSISPTSKNNQRSSSDEESKKSTIVKDRNLLKSMRRGLAFLKSHMERKYKNQLINKIIIQSKIAVIRKCMVITAGDEDLTAILKVN